MRILSLFLLLGIIGEMPAKPRPALKDGDRVVLVGSTLIEREQRYGFWEMAIRAAMPGKHLTIRNLGWSGDTVEGHARAGFKTVQVGFQRLVSKVKEAKPTVIILGYGTNESFAGKAGLDAFVKNYEKLLDQLASTKARLVFLSPIPLEKLGAPLPDPAEQNQRLALYTDAIQALALKRKGLFVDLFHPLQTSKPRENPLTDNGMHLTADGYRRTAAVLLRGLGWSHDPRMIHIENSRLTRVPLPCDRLVRTYIESLERGKHTLTAGKHRATASASEWKKGVYLKWPLGMDQSEKLRKAIIEKNRLFFHRWRPQNVTYLFGRRKHEQGNNAKEVPQFDPLIKKADASITDLTVPKTSIKVQKQ